MRESKTYRLAIFILSLNSTNHEFNLLKTTNRVAGQHRSELVGRLGFEPRTNRLKAWCSTN